MTTPDPLLAPPPRRLVRPAHRTFGGVSAALGAYADVDPVLFRVLFVALTIFGGSGILLYALGWVLIPEEGAPLSPAERWLQRRRHRPFPLVLLAIVLAAIVGGTHFGVATAALIAVGAYLLLRPREPRPFTEPDPFAVGPAAGPAPWEQPLPRQVGSPRLALGVAGVSVAVVVAGVLLAVFAHPIVPSSVIVGIAVAIAGFGLAASAWVRGWRLPAVLGALLVPFVVAATVGLPVASSGTGQRTFVVSNAAELQPSYRLGAGRLTLDLTGLDTGLNTAAGATRHVDAHVDMGEILVRLPADVPVHVTARAGVGDVQLLGVDSGGPHVQRDAMTGTGTPQLDLDLSAGMGHVEVTRG